jgi:hypothetical protein
MPSSDCLRYGRIIGPDVINGAPRIIDLTCPIPDERYEELYRKLAEYVRSM